MTSGEAAIIFRSWQDYMEIADKFRKLMLIPPASFLPYPPDVIEEALVITAQELSDAGDHAAADVIRGTAYRYLAAYLVTDAGRPLNDERALEKMHQTLGFILADAQLKKTVLDNLAVSQERWRGVRHPKLNG